ncbi:hypothetical protein Pla175_42130 [Pirellulimonas nuda]|uniref:Uncharacterized protein n=1 Tax=Pirellulimonas nuda TaxID=2528009 RepID=A0A518DH48_9BACT|nr:hypothetical protein Pla175_42130 [Pirellulimonas nuda]
MPAEPDEPFLDALGCVAEAAFKLPEGDPEKVDVGGVGRQAADLGAGRFDGPGNAGHLGSGGRPSTPRPTP